MVLSKTMAKIGVRNLKTATDPAPRVARAYPFVMAASDKYVTMLSATKCSKSRLLVCGMPSKKHIINPTVKPAVYMASNVVVELNPFNALRDVYETPAEMALPNAAT